MSLVLPKGPRSAAGRVALRLVLLLKVVEMPLGAPLNNTFALLAKFVPVNCT